ncbi:MAG: DUF4232 domain-containing protein [Jatrophihabitans sp.]
MRRRQLAAAIVLLGLGLSAGCTRAPQPKADDPAVAISTSPSGPVSSPAGSPVASSTAPSTPAASSTPTAKASRTPAGPVEAAGGCPTAALKLTALRASGAAGHQYAFLQFTNTGATACSLTGFPGVQLLRAGAPLGQPAQRSAKAVHTVRIAPGGSVTAQVVDDSTCNADNSDSVQVIAPNRTERVVLRLAVRGCPLHVDPVIAS